MVTVSFHMKEDTVLEVKTHWFSLDNGSLGRVTVFATITDMEQLANTMLAWVEAHKAGG